MAFLEPLERKQYDCEFKAQVVQMCEQAEVPIAQIASVAIPGDIYVCRQGYMES